MVIQHHAGQKLTYQTGDTLPSTLPANYEAWNTLTGIVSYYNGVAWRPRTLKSPYKFIIYRDGGNTHCADANGFVLATSTGVTDRHIPLQYALDNGIRSDIWVCNGSYSTDISTFTGYRITQVETHVKFDTGALMSMPEGYTGKALIFDATSGTGISICQIEGGRWSENSATPSRNWDCIHLKGLTNGINSCRFKDMYIRMTNRSLLLETLDVDGWVNGNSFENIFTDSNKVGLEFIGFDPNSSRINSNEFYNFVYQCSGDYGVPSYGFKNIMGDRNNFWGCKAWDMHVGNAVSVSSNLAVGATNCMLIGGIMTGTGFTDVSDGSNFYWDWDNRFLGPRRGDTSTAMFPVLSVGGYDFWRNIPMPGVKKTGGWNGNGSTSSSYGLVEGRVANHDATPSTAVDSDGIYTKYTTTAVAGNQQGNRTVQAFLRREHNAYFEVRIKPIDVTGCRIGAGVVQSGTIPAPGSEPLVSIGGAILWLDDGGTTWKVRRNTNGATSVQSDSGVSVVAGTVYKVGLKLDNVNARLYWSFNNGATWTATTSTLPAATSNLNPMVWVESADGTAKAIQVYYWHVESDK